MPAASPPRRSGARGSLLARGLWAGSLVFAAGCIAAGCIAAGCIAAGLIATGCTAERGAEPARPGSSPAERAWNAAAPAEGSGTVESVVHAVKPAPAPPGEVTQAAEPRITPRHLEAELNRLQAEIDR
jgi:hypothetical protein